MQLTWSVQPVNAGRLFRSWVLPRSRPLKQPLPQIEYRDVSAYCDSNPCTRSQSSGKFPNGAASHTNQKRVFTSMELCIRYKRSPYCPASCTGFQGLWTRTVYVPPSLIIYMCIHFISRNFHFANFWARIAYSVRCFPNYYDVYVL